MSFFFFSFQLKLHRNENEYYRTEEIKIRSEYIEDRFPSYAVKFCRLVVRQPLEKCSTFPTLVVKEASRGGNRSLGSLANNESSRRHPGILADFLSNCAFRGSEIGRKARVSPRFHVQLAVWNRFGLFETIHATKGRMVDRFSKDFRPISKLFEIMRFVLSSTIDRYDMNDRDI